MRIQLALISAIFGIAAVQELPAQTAQLDTTTFILMGEGLGAGMANFGLSSVMQKKDFGALITSSMNTGFEQPLIQPPGLGDVLGYQGQEVKVQTYPQGSVRQTYLPTDPAKAPIAGPPLFVTNISVPGLTLNEAVTLRPSPPVVQKSMKQTTFNMILGFPQLIFDNVPLWTQFEYGQAMFPTVTMIELGYYEALNAAVNGDPTLMPDPAAFGATYGNVIAGYRSLQSQVIVTTIPNPIDTAYFNTLAAAAQVDQLPQSYFEGIFNVNLHDYITRNGLQEIYTELFTRVFTPLPPGSVMSAATAADITNRVNALNAQIVSAAKAKGAFVYDLNAFLHNIKANGATAGGSTVNGDYFGGFYSLDGYYPSATGHALIANDMLKFINQTYGKNFPLVNVTPIAASDPMLNLQRPKDGTLDRVDATGSIRKSTRR
jgi:hypothetical protein